MSMVEGTDILLSCFPHVFNGMLILTWLSTTEPKADVEPILHPPNQGSRYVLKARCP